MPLGGHCSVTVAKFRPLDDKYGLHVIQGRDAMDSATRHHTRFPPAPGEFGFLIIEPASPQRAGREFRGLPLKLSYKQHQLSYLPAHFSLVFNNIELIQ